MQGPDLAVLAFAALTVALSMSNSTAPVTACVPACLPPEAQSAGLAMYNSVSGVGGYFGPAMFGWLKDATGSNAPGMVVRPFLPIVHRVCVARTTRRDRSLAWYKYDFRHLVVAKYPQDMV